MADWAGTRARVYRIDDVLYLGIAASEVPVGLASIRWGWGRNPARSVRIGARLPTVGEPQIPEQELVQPTTSLADRVLIRETSWGQHRELESGLASG